MENLDRLFDDITHDTPLEMERVDELKVRIKRESELQQKKWLLLLTLNCLIGLALMFAGAIMVNASQNVQIMFYGCFLFIIGFDTTVLVKLAYGNLISQAKILQTLREVQVSVLEHLSVQDSHNGRNRA